MALTDFQGRYVFIKLYSNFYYTGTIKEVEFMGFKSDGSPYYIVSMTDKFGKFVAINSREIKSIEEQDPKAEEVLK